MPHVTYLGFPRIGRRRELKRALESHWKGETSASDLLATAATLRQRHWQLAREAGADSVPVNDFSLYDHVLDATALVGAVPDRYGAVEGDVDLDTYFAMARGRQEGGVDVTATEDRELLRTDLVADAVAGVGDVESARGAHRVGEFDVGAIADPLAAVVEAL